MIAVFIGQVLGVVIIVLVYEGFQKLFKRTQNPKLWACLCATALFLTLNILGALWAIR